MKKMPTIYQRDFAGDSSKVTDELHPDCSWVFDGEGVAMRKYDGTSCMFDGKQLWKRREVKPGQAAPSNFVLADHDQKTGKLVGWVPITPLDKWHVEGVMRLKDLTAGTYELCGPKVQGNPEGYDRHVLVPHADAEVFHGVERTFEGIRSFLSKTDCEGIVFRHPDGRMAKIKGRDFGLKRGGR